MDELDRDAARAARGRARRRLLVYMHLLRMMLQQVMRIYDWLAQEVTVALVANGMLEESGDDG